LEREAASRSRERCIPGLCRVLRRHRLGLSEYRLERTQIQGEERLSLAAILARRRPATGAVSARRFRFINEN